MASMIDRGDSYRVAYLGSAQLQQMATGLGVLQKPLRELYIKARKPGSSNALQQRQLTMTRDGMRMSYKHKQSAPLEEEFYASPFIILWDAVRFVLVQSHDKKDKRPRCAFEPLDNDHSHNKDNLFSPLDKKYKFLAQQQHGAIFTCVLRRTKGVKALDIHAFMCASDEEAIGLVHALNTVHSGFSSDQATETGVFGYSPFGKSTVRVTAGNAAQFAKTPPSVRRANELRGVTPRSNTPAHKQPQHVRNVFQHTPVVSHNSAPHHSGANQLAQQRRVFHLSQEDLLAPQLQISPGFEDFDIDAPGHSQLAEAEYEYVGTIRKHEVKKLEDIDFHGVKRRQKGAASSRNDQKLSNRHSIHDTHNLVSPQHSPPNLYPFGNQLRGKAGSTAAQESHHPAAKLGQGYGLLSGPGDGSVDAISITSRAHNPPSRPITVSVSQSRQLFRDLQEFQSRHQEEGNSAAQNRGPLMRPSKSPGYLDKPPNMGRSLENVSHMDTSLYVNTNDPMPDRSRNREPEKEATPPPPRQKPIARVPPHMKTGIRVLPENFSIPPPRNTDQNKSKSDRTKSGLFSKNNTAPNDRPASGLFMKSPTGLPQDNAASVASQRSKSQSSLVQKDWTPARSDNSDSETNWQFGSNNKEDKYKQTVKNNLNAGNDKKMGEKLLMSKKKDAEIASVMQNLKLDYRDTPTLTPGAPSGMNFEKSLGYFP